MLFALIFLFSLSAFGQENHANKAYAKSQQGKLELEDFHELAKQLEFAISAFPAKGKGCNGCGSEIQNFEPIRTNDKNGILVFVSFSMPKSSLIELNNQAKKYNAKLIMRGIHQNSFSKTKEKILEIEPKGLTVDIDPQLFKQYKIKRVPTFVLLKDGREVGRLRGNVSLEFVHKKLVEVHK